MLLKKPSAGADGFFNWHALQALLLLPPSFNFLALFCRSKNLL